jgi:hypothetical protein
MTRKRTINAGAVARDMTSDMTEAELKAKYNLTSESLQKVYRKLVRCEAVSHAELYEKSPLYRSAIDNMKLRIRPRADVHVPVPILEMGSKATGLVRDLSEKGLRIAGISSREEEVKAFELPLDVFVPCDPLLIVGKCRWSQTKGKRGLYPVAGFEIMDIRDSDLQVLRKFINLLVLTKSGVWQATR